MTLYIYIYLNGLSDTTHTLTAASFYNTVGSIEPDSYSPVLKRNLTIYMDENFDDTLEVDDLKVNLIQQEDSTIVKACNVIDVDNDVKSITVRYGGAYGGMYDLEVISSTFGRILTDDITFEAVGTITDI